MPKINIAGVKSGNGINEIHLVLTETQQVEGQNVEVPIGEAFIPIPEGTTKARTKSIITARAREIKAQAEKARLSRESLAKDLDGLEV